MALLTFTFYLLPFAVCRLPFGSEGSVGGTANKDSTRRISGEFPGHVRYTATELKLIWGKPTLSGSLEDRSLFNLFIFY